jgi:competence protein ComEA
MKHAWWIILVFGLFVSINLFPKEDETLKTKALKPAFEVTLTGAVVFPGTYTFFEPIHFNQIVKMAGGYMNEDDQYQASYFVSKSISIHVPFKEDEALDESTRRININTANFQELLTLPYMSETKVAYLMMYRLEHGPFQSIDAILEVKYIGDATLEAIRPFVTTS